MKVYRTWNFLILLLACFIWGACDNANQSGPNPPNPPILTLNFGTPLTLPAGMVPTKAQSVIAQDLNGDGNVDFAILNSTVGVFLGNGNGTFQTRQDATSTLMGPSALASWIFDGSANGELAASFPATNQIDIFFDPEGDGQYASGAPYNGGVGPEGITVGDFNKDGLEDIALPNSDGNLHLKINTGAATFNDFSFPSNGNLLGARNIASADFNGDGSLDVAIADFGGDKLIVWLSSGNANPAFLFPASNIDASLTLPAGSAVQGVTAADLNGDGFPDLIAPLPTPGQLAVFLNQGDGSFGGPSQFDAGADAFGAAVADFNQDNFLDIVVANAFGDDGVNGDFSIYLGNGDGSFQAPQFFTAGQDTLAQPNHPRSVAVGDFNQDGLPDIVMASSPGDSAVVVLNTSN